MVTAFELLSSQPGAARRDALAARAGTIPAQTRVARWGSRIAPSARPGRHRWWPPIQRRWPLQSKLV